MSLYLVLILKKTNTNPINKAAEVFVVINIKTYNIRDSDCFSFNISLLKFVRQNKNILYLLPKIIIISHFVDFPKLSNLDWNDQPWQQKLFSFLCGITYGYKSGGCFRKILLLSNLSNDM